MVSFSRHFPYSITVSFKYKIKHGEISFSIVAFGFWILLS